MAQSADGIQRRPRGEQRSCRRTGSHRRPKPPSRSRLAALAATAGTVSLLPTQSQAAPKPSVDEVRQQIAELYEEAEKPTEEYNAIPEKKVALQKEARQAQDQVAEQQAEINELRGKMGPVAAAQYRNGGLDPSVQLFLSSDPDDYLGRAEALGRFDRPELLRLLGSDGRRRALAGVSLPRTVQQQYSAGRQVARSDLQPGDIIYWYNSSQHNGLYIGNGKAIHAPRTGKNVEITPLDAMPHFAATRP
ncbi:NlpC/P60 domain-containing protein OS=Streptomyces aurantiogriseus OX=66870 GN=GCM10010251_49510 PE=3 SV=1 [Streptomyces aurantiogriseus]|uniref:NlpC/P60 domain-containing protein n=1 Tax=Streptomyces aurantiogriseus TaxID=66870 RepID=A0A918CJP4_9ACTN|nr:NlpC/P60 family protein [Streptomyces aurantiogriseus]GGR27643.1 hypothetical protein GCM10010251_49510 [Streptomyces aurantiogriseus]